MSKNERILKGEKKMEKFKKLVIAFCMVALMVSNIPIHAKAEECQNHEWSDWNVSLEPFCFTEGIQTRYCKLCGEMEMGTIPVIGYHTWLDWSIEESPSCGTAGLQIRTCFVCAIQEKEEIPPTGNHSWQKWKVIKGATALSVGKKIRFCRKCPTDQTEEIPKLEAKIFLNSRSMTIERGKSKAIKIKSKTYGDKKAKWFSSNNKIATINEKGKVTGKQIGTATITLKMKSGVKATCKINVTKPKQNTNSGHSHSSNSGSHSSGNSTAAPSSGYVWIPNTGSKYHKTSTCSGMKNPSKVTVKEAKSYGYEPCSKCY